MSTITARDAGALLEIVHDGATASGTELFPTTVLERLRQLIPSDAYVGYQEVDITGGRCRRILDVVDVTGHEDPPAVVEAYRRLGRQDPLRDPLRAREPRVLMLSSFFTRSQLRRLEFYREVWRPCGIDDALRMWFPAPADRAYALFLERGGKPYSERDRTLLQLLRPHLIRFRDNAAFRRRARTTSILTEREHEVMGWIERGKTNAEVASLLHVSPHTVRTHLENVFEKLGVRTLTAAVARVRELQAA